MEIIKFRLDGMVEEQLQLRLNILIDLTFCDIILDCLVKHVLIVSSCTLSLYDTGIVQITLIIIMSYVKLSIMHYFVI